MSSALRKSAQNRILILSLSLFFWMAVIVIRLVVLQVLQHAELLDRALRQQQQIVNIVPHRGGIFDRNNNDLAMSVDVDSLAAWGSQIKNPAAVSQALAPILKMDSREIESRLASARGFVWIKRKLDQPEAEAVRALNLKGLEFIKESRRYYPKRELAAQVLGYVGMDNEGLGGVEYFYDNKIKGSPGHYFVQVDAHRHRYARQEPGRSTGDETVLTLDERIQYITENALKEAMEKTQAEAGTAIVMNPHTGEILALANAPDFNPNSYKLFDPDSWKDRAVQSIYEPGSTFKIITVAAALEEGLTNPDEVVDCQMGSIVLAGHTIHDHERLGMLTVSQIISKSSDVGAIKLGLRLGDDRFYKYIRAFGFGSLTGIDLPGEVRGIARDPSQWSKISIGALSMGQEVGVTPIQILRAVATIANDGVAVRPFITREIRDFNGHVVVANAPQFKRVVSARTAVSMKKMLEGVVLYGTGRNAKLDGYTAAGKTGTAQKTDPQTGRYYHDKYVASFVGFTPVNNPEIALMVVLDSPKGYLHQGGQVAAPAWKLIAEQTLRYLNVPPELPLMEVAKKVKAPAPEDTVSDFESNDLSAQSGGQDVLLAVPAPDFHVQPAAHYPASNSGDTRVEDVKTFQATANTVTVPSLIGKSLREAAVECREVGIALEVEGSGFVVAQNPSPGALVPPQSKVMAKFARHYEKGTL
ncbi:MAG: penicillin-binding protein [Acidobacteriia bacterium]|nr:penicillin-binding protein [Terriglobia bacterium]